MFTFSDRAVFNDIKRQISLLIEEVRQEAPEAAAYLEEHMVMDEKALTFCYTGDDRFAMFPQESIN